MGHHAGKCFCLKITDQRFISLLARIRPCIIPSRHSADNAPGIVIHFKHVSRVIRGKSVYFFLIRESAKLSSRAFEPLFLRATMVVHCLNNHIAWVPYQMEHARSFVVQNPFASREIGVSVKADHGRSKIIWCLQLLNKNKGNSQSLCDLLESCPHPDRSGLVMCTNHRTTIHEINALQAG